MNATLVERPPKGDDWLFEIKWDGVRALCFIDGEEFRITTRSGNRCERQYPELTVTPHYLAARQAILDGEIAVLDAKGVARFERIQPRIAQSDPGAIARLARTHPAVLYLFDLLYLDGYDLRQAPLAQRKATLQQILTPSPAVRYSEHFAGAGEEMLAAAREAGLEGILAKHAASLYEPRRSREWLKIKLNNEDDFVICGFTAGEREEFASLVLGAWEGDQLVWVGLVGAGFDQKTLRDLLRRMQPLITPDHPFERKPAVPRAVTWVRPELLCRVKFLNRTEDHKLRAPVFLGLREDLEPPRRVKFTNVDKTFYPADGYTKGDVLQYYDDIADLILPHLKDRPLSLKRYPNGIAGEYFFHQDMPESVPGWLRTEAIDTRSDRKRWAFAEDRDSLLYLVNLGCIDHNPWMSKYPDLEHPDFILIDLDPQEDCPFEWIVEAAQRVKSRLDAIGLAGYPKTTGGDGMHVYIPVEPVYTFEETRAFAEIIARLVIREKPDLFTTPRPLAKREKGKVYFDYLQNAKGKTIAAPYVLRARPGAPVAAPLRWGEVVPGLTPEQFHLGNARDRFARLGDVFEGALTNRQRLEGPLQKLMGASGR